MAVVLFWTRIELRRRWRPLLVLALLVALAAGALLAAILLAAVPAHRATRLAVAPLLRVR